MLLREHGLPICFAAPRFSKNSGFLGSEPRRGCGCGGGGGGDMVQLPFLLPRDDTAAPAEPRGLREH
ncbi:hypothetical protein E2C01_047873 [Portunus trituberculatus]|uniref:Uncharacterized protein n=1 Tax=Portunus trituberculatus TaxID=210409 RepID=A0A5B7GA08_PORTR|nr:hypothetical protein [Portunus trituberculatus]